MGVWGALLQGVLSVDSSIGESREEGKQFDKNIAMARDAEADARARGTQEAGEARMAGGQVAAKQMVAFSNSGVDASVGTAANVVASTRARAELDALTVENNAAREAWGYRKHGIEFQTQAGINHARRNREMAGTVLGSLGNAASSYNTLVPDGSGGMRKKGFDV